MSTVGTSYNSHKIKDQFDIIVIGSGMGGLTVSSLLAQNGKKVLLLEQHYVIGGCTQVYMRKGYEWGIGVHYIGGVQSEKQLTWKLFNAVTGSNIRWDPMPDLYNQIVIDDQVYDFYAGADRYAEQLKTYFPDEVEAIDAYISLLYQANAASSSFFANKALPIGVEMPALQESSEAFAQFANQTTLDVLSQLTDNQELIAVICGNWGDYSLPPSQSAFAMHAMLIRHYIGGASYPRGGPAAFADSMVPIIEAAGGLVCHSAEVGQVLIEDGVAIGVELVNGDKLYAPSVVSNAGIENTYTRMLDSRLVEQAGISNKLSSVQSSYCVVTLNVGLNKSGDELGLPVANTWAHPSADLDQNIKNHQAQFEAPFAWTFLTFPSQRDSTWETRHPNKSIIEMYCHTDFKYFASWQETPWMKRGADYDQLKDEIKQRMIDELVTRLPSIKGSIDYAEVSTPLSYEHFLRRKTGGFLGLEASPERFRQDWIRVDTPFKNLYLTGQDVVTDGIVGAMMGGILSASRILGRNLVMEIAQNKWQFK